MHPPEHVGQITETRSGDELRLTWRWRTPLNDGLTFLLGVVIVGRAVTATSPSVMDLILVVLVGVAVQVWWNVSTVVVSPRALTLTTGPVFGGTKAFNRRDIAGLRIVEQRINWLKQYTLVADVHRDGGLHEVQLLVRSPRGAMVRHLEQRIKAGLLGRG